jgi:hypothetical protein
VGVFISAPLDARVQYWKAEVVPFSADQCGISAGTLLYNLKEDLVGEIVHVDCLIWDEQLFRLGGTDMVICLQ